MQHQTDNQRRTHLLSSQQHLVLFQVAHKTILLGDMLCRNDLGFQSLVLQLQIS